MSSYQPALNCQVSRRGRATLQVCEPKSGHDVNKHRKIFDLVWIVFQRVLPASCCMYCTKAALCTSLCVRSILGVSLHLPCVHLHNGLRPRVLVRGLSGASVLAFCLAVVFCPTMLMQTMWSQGRLSRSSALPRFNCTLKSLLPIFF